MRLAQTYLQLPETLYAPTQPSSVSNPSWVAFNHALLSDLGLDESWSGPEGLAVLSGQTPMADSTPLAMAYAGHQFGHWVPILGDGRALMLGQHQDTNGRWWDIQLKGSGPTPFSRNGDGRSSLGPVVREYLASEAMAALGIPTTRALAAIATGESVHRQSIEPGGVLVRVAQSHIRVGTFEFLARLGDVNATQTLLDFCIRRHCPEFLGNADRALQWFEWVVSRTAELMAQWMQVGFIHGVMNTDNCSVVGETLDYGPFGFLDAFNPTQVYSSIDHAGRYAYNRQPAIATWNLARLAESLLPLIDTDVDQATEKAQATLAVFPQVFQTAFESAITRKVGLDPMQENHCQIAMDFLDLMANNDADMTWSFRRLGSLSIAPDPKDEVVRALFDDPQAFDAWAVQWRDCLAQLNEDDERRGARMHQINPAFILRNHLAQEAVDAAVESFDFGPMNKLLQVLEKPFDDQPEVEAWAGPPAPEARVLTTFCGT
jgi:uncharacterized protein YdiU (UPF0061 family)